MKARSTEFYAERMAKIRRQEEYVVRVSMPKEMKPVKNAKSEKKIAKKNYWSAVRKHVESQPLRELENFELRRFGEYVLNFIVSIKDGFKHEIPVEVIGDIKNLRIIPWSEYPEKAKSDPEALERMLAKIKLQKP